MSFCLSNNLSLQICANPPPRGARPQTPSSPECLRHLAVPPPGWPGPCSSVSSPEHSWGQVPKLAVGRCWSESPSVSSCFRTRPPLRPAVTITHLRTHTLHSPYRAHTHTHTHIYTTHMHISHTTHNLHITPTSPTSHTHHTLTPHAHTHRTCTLAHMPHSYAICFLGFVRPPVLSMVRPRGSASPSSLTDLLPQHGVLIAGIGLLLPFLGLSGRPAPHATTPQHLGRSRSKAPTARHFSSLRFCYVQKMVILIPSARPQFPRLQDGHIDSPLTWCCGVQSSREASAGLASTPP